MKEYLLFVFGFCIGVGAEYLNVCFWKRHAKNKYSKERPTHKEETKSPLNKTTQNRNI